MGFFSAFRASTTYEKVLKAYDINPHAFGPDVNSRICSYAKQRYERIASRWPDQRSQSNLDANVRDAAMFTAFCALGPTEFRATGGDDVEFLVRLETAARDWREEGPEAQLDTMIIKTLNDSGFLSDEFVERFNALL